MIAGIKWTSIVTEKGHLSLGRVLAIVCFGLLCWFWFTSPDVPPTLVTIFLTLMGYNVSKKVTNPIQSYLDGRAKQLTQKDRNDGKEG